MPKSSVVVNIIHYRQLLDKVGLKKNPPINIVMASDWITSPDKANTVKDSMLLSIIMLPSGRVHKKRYDYLLFQKDEDSSQKVTVFAVTSSEDKPSLTNDTILRLSRQFRKDGIQTSSPTVVVCRFDLLYLRIIP